MEYASTEARENLLTYVTNSWALLFSCSTVKNATRLVNFSKHELPLKKLSFLVLKYQDWGIARVKDAAQFSWWLLPKLRQRFVKSSFLTINLD
jgi:hypothetical protein